MKFFYDDDKYINVVDRRKIKKLKRKYFHIEGSDIFDIFFKKLWSVQYPTGRENKRCISSIFISYIYEYKIPDLLAYAKRSPIKRVSNYDANGFITDNTIGIRYFPYDNVSLLLIFKTKVEMISFKLRYM